MQYCVIIISLLFSKIVQVLYIGSLQYNTTISYITICGRCRKILQINVRGFMLKMLKRFARFDFRHLQFDTIIGLYLTYIICTPCEFLQPVSQVRHFCHNNTDQRDHLTYICYKFNDTVVKKDTLVMCQKQQRIYVQSNLC